MFIINLTKNIIKNFEKITLEKGINKQD